MELGLVNAHGPQPPSGGPNVPGVQAQSQAAGTGTVSVTALKRGHLQIAPDAVFFRADVTAPGLIQATTRGEYDESFHKVLYVWDFGDPGARSRKVVNLPAAHNDLNRAYGKEVGHLFRRPGPYQVTCTAYDADGALIGRGEMQIDVGDPETRFHGDRTIVIDPDGRGDPARYPEAQIAPDLDTALEALGALDEGPGRILLKRGTQIRQEARLVLRGRDPQDNIYLAPWGPAEAAAPQWLSTGEDLIYIHARFDSDVVLQGIDFRGPWDSISETGAQPTALRCEQEDGRCIILDDCNFSGFGTVFHTINETEPHGSLFVLHECDITNWGNYGGFFGPNPGQMIAILGCAIHQHPEALMGGGGRKEGDTNQHGPLRLAHGGHTHISACDLFSRNGWSRAAGLAADQPCLRWSTRPEGQEEVQSSCNVERTAMEGGFVVVMVRDQDDRGAYFGTNFVMDKCLLVGTARSWGFVEVQYTGTTIRNCLMIRPDSPMVTNRWRAAFIRVDEGQDSQQAHPDRPVEIYNNTYVNLMSAANLDGDIPAIEADIERFERFSFENNVAFTPGDGDAVEDPRLSTAPLETAGGTGTGSGSGVWATRYFGVRYNDVAGSGAQWRMLTEFATPERSVADFAPLDGSPVIDDASGRVAVDDFWGRRRGPDPDRGAIER